MKTVRGVDDPAFSANGTAPGLLDGYRVRLGELIDSGVPDPAWVPGCDGWLRAGKRYLIPAAAGTGKSLAWLRIAVGIVEAGGGVVVLDAENGSDEYARRLECILDACGRPGGLDDRLRYYEWPRLDLKWNPDEWVAAVGPDIDVVVFDSSRMLLSQSGLDEDKSGDYAEFVDALLTPLSKAGVATVTLDNCGHDQTRARGTKAKEDLNEVVYETSARGTIDADSTGVLTMKATRQRFSGIHRRLEMQTGGGVYEMPHPVEESRDEEGNFRPTVLMKRVSDWLADHPGASGVAVKTEVKGDTKTIPVALKQLITEGFVRTEPGPRGAVQHHLVRSFSE